MGVGQATIMCTGQMEDSGLGNFDSVAKSRRT